MLSDTYYTILNVWLFKNDKFAVLLPVITSANGILHLKMDDSYYRSGSYSREVGVLARGAIPSRGRNFSRD